MLASLKLARGVSGENLVALGERVNLTISVQIPEGQTTSFTVRPSLGAPYGLDVFGYTFSAGSSLTTSGGSYNGADESFTFTSVSNTANNVVNVNDRLDITLTMRVNATARQWVTDAAQRLYLTLSSTTTTLSPWTSPAFRISQSAQRTNITFSPGAGDGLDNITATVYLRQPHQICGDTTGTSLTLTCEVGVMTNIVYASYGTANVASCSNLLNTASMTNGACIASTSLSYWRTACLSKTSCTVPTSAFTDPCAGTTKRLSAIAECGYPTTATYSTDLTIAVSRQFLNPRSFASSLSGITATFDTPSWSWIVDNVPSMNIFDIATFTYVATVNATVETGDSLPVTAPPLYYSTPELVIQSQGPGAGNFPILTPTISLAGTTSLIDTQYVSSSNREYLAPGESGVYTYTVQLWEGSTTNGIFTINVDVPWINITSATLTRLGGNISPQTIPLVSLQNNFFADLSNDFVTSTIGNRVMNVSGSNFNWQFVVVITFDTLDLSGTSRGAGGTFQARFTSLKTSTTNTRYITFSEPQIQTKVYCQGTSAVSAGVGFYTEYWNNAVDNVDGPVIQRLETTSGFDWGSGSPAVQFPADAFTSRIRGCVSSLNGTVAVNTRQFRLSGDDAIRVTLGDKRYDLWAPNAFSGSRDIVFSVPSGTCVPFWLEQIETTGNANSKITWRQNATGSFVDIPLANTYPVPPVHTAESQLDCEIHVWAIYTQLNFAGVFNVSLVHDLTSASLVQGAYVASSLGATPRAGNAIIAETTVPAGGPGVLMTTSYLSTTAGDVIRIPFRATVSNNAELGRMFNSVANVTFRSAPGAYARSYSMAVNVIKTPVVMSPFVNISVVSTSNDLTGDTRYTGGVPDIAIGELVTVLIDVEFRPGQASNSSLVFSLPYAATSPLARFGITDASFVRAGSDLSISGSYATTYTNSTASIRDGLYDTVSFATGNVYFNPANWAASNFASRSIRFSVTFYPSNTAPAGFTVSNRLLYPRAEFRSSLTTPFGVAPIEVVSPVLQAAKAVAGPVVAGSYPLTMWTTVTHNSASQSPAFRVNQTDSSSFLSTGSTNLPSVFSAPRWVTANMTLGTTWNISWTHYPISSELECGLSTFPVSTISYAADPLRASGFTVNSGSPTIATPVARVVQLQFVDSGLNPIANPKYTFQQSIFALATVNIPSARCTNLQIRVLTPAGKVSLVGIDTVTPGANMTTSLSSWDSVKTAISSPTAGQFVISAGNVLYSGPTQLNNNLTMLLRLTISDPSCTLTGSVMTIQAAAQSSLSGGYSAARNASLTIDAPQTQISFNDYVVSKCQQWALLQPPVTTGTETLFTSVPQGWTLASNNSDSIDVIREMVSTWSTIVPSGGCILTFVNNSGSITVVGYTTTGAFCPGPYTFQVSLNDTACVGTNPKDRILLRGTSSTNCDIQQNRFCEPTPPIRLIGSDPTQYTNGLQVFPNDFYVFAAPGTSNLTLPLNVYLPSAPVMDILLVLDTNGLASGDYTQLTAGVGNFFSRLTDSSFFRADNPAVGLVTVNSVGRVYTYSVRSPLTSSASELTTAMALVTPTSTTGSTNVLGALNEIMADNAGIGWRARAYKMVVVISENDHYDDLTINATSISSNIVTSFYSGNPTPAVSGRYTGLAAGLPLGRYSSGPLTTVSNLGTNKYNGWGTGVSLLVKNTYLTITVVAAGDHSDATPFIRALPAKLDVSASPSLPYPTSYTRNITVGWPSNLDPEIQSSYRALGQFMGFGAVGVRLTANTRPDAAAVNIIGNEDTDIPLTLAVSDRDKNKLEVKFLTGPSSLFVRLLLASDSSIVAYNTWYQTVDFILRPAADYYGSVTYTYAVSDRCANDTNVVSVTINNVNDNPVATDFSFTLNEDEATAANQRITFTSYISDIDNPTNSLTVWIVDLPSPTLGDLVLESGATVVNPNTVVTNQNVRFVPRSNLNGVCTFTYLVRDPANGVSQVATVTVTVVPVNDAPVLTVPTNPVYGRIRGPFPTQDFTAVINDADAGDSVTLQVTALGSGVNNLLSHTFQVTVPCCSAVISNTTVGLPISLTSPQSVVTSNQDIIATIRWNIAILFNDVNPHRFTLRARDSTGALSNVVTVDLRVSDNTPPFTVDPELVVLNEDDVRFPVQVSGYDEDYGDYLDRITLVISRLPVHGRLYASGPGALALGASVTKGNVTSNDDATQVTTYTIFYSPFANYNGDDSFNFQFRDRNGALSTPKTQQLLVLPVNDAPTTAGFNVTTYQDIPIRIVGFSGADIDGGDVLSLQIVTQPNGLLQDDSNVTLVLPADFSAGDDWAVVYTPPVFGCDDTKAFTSFNFRICDQDTCSLNATVYITVICVNHPPSGADKTVTALQETPLRITLDATDRDLFDPPSVLVVQITSTNLAGKGALYKDAALTQPITLFESIAFPHQLYFLGAPDVYSENNVPVGTFQYQVVDPGTFISRPRNTISVVIQRVNKPPRYLGNLDVYTDEDVPVNFFFLSDSAIFDDGFRLGFGVRGFILASTHRGSFRVCDVNDTCTAVNTTGGVASGNFVNLPAPVELTHRQGRAIFTSEQYTYANNYTALRLGLLDDEGLWTNYTLRIHVRPVNNAPVVTPLFPSGFDNPSLWEDSQYVLRWLVTDVDSDPSTLRTDIIIISASRRLRWNLFPCSSSNGTFDVNWCTHDNLTTPSATEAGAGFVPSFSSSSSSCNTVEGYPTTDFSNCYVEFRMIFRPYANLFSYRYTQMILQGLDDKNATSSPVDAVMSVRPVNDAPSIWAPATLTADPGSGRILLRGESDINASPAVIGVDDIDAPQAVALNLTITVVNKDGTINFNGTACALVSEEVDNVYNCVENLKKLNERLLTSEFVVANAYLDSEIEVVVKLFIDDLGWVGEDNEPHLNASTSIRIIYTPATQITVPPSTGNALFIATAVAAAAALILLGLLAWRLRKTLKAPQDDYFQLGVSSISTAAVNPLFKKQGKEGDNPLYRANNNIPDQ